MWNLIQNAIKDAFMSMAESLSEWVGSGFAEMLPMVLNFEEHTGEGTWIAAIEDLYNKFYWFCVGLLALKLLWKGFKVYGLWRDGDPENDPMLLLKDSAFALATAAAFPALYKILASVIEYVLSLVVDCFPNFTEQTRFDNMGATMAGVQTSTLSIGMVIMLIVVMILIIVMYFKMMVQGAVMMVLRLGVPFAAIGLLDSDGGIWKSYVQLLFREVITVVAQLALLMMGTAICMSGYDSSVMLIVSIGCMAGAWAVPKQLSQIMMPAGGGNAMGTASQAAMLANAVKGFIAAA